MIKLAVVSDNIDNRYHTKHDSDDTLYETKVGVLRRSSSMFLLGIVEQPLTSYHIIMHIGKNKPQTGLYV